MKDPASYLPDPAAIEAILPVYTERGDETVIYTADGGRRVVPRQIRSVLKSLAVIQNRSLPAMRKNAQKLTGQAKNLPLAFSPSLVLARIKTRAARVRSDCTLGCINVARTVEIVPAINIRPLAQKAVGKKAGRRRPRLAGAAATARIPLSGSAADQTPPDETAPRSTVRLASGRSVGILWTPEAARGQFAAARALENDLLKKLCREFSLAAKLGTVN